MSSRQSHPPELMERGGGQRAGGAADLAGPEPAVASRLANLHQKADLRPL